MGAGVSTAAKKPEVRVARAEFLAAAAKTAQLPPAGAPEVAFAGRSNVGKSSLLNMLLARKGLAKTSRTPGRTRQIVLFDVGIAGGPTLSFVDLPGYGYAKVSKSESASWKELLEGYLEHRPTLRAIVLLVDVRRGIEQEERDLLDFLAAKRSEIAVVIAVMKGDKISRSALKPALAAIEKQAGVRVIGTSAETRAGREELWSRILHEVV